MPKISEADRAARRQHLVDAAWRRIAEAGYRDTTVDDVCDEAGVSKGAFYGYFETKQDLLIALLDEETETLAALAGELSDLEISGGERVRLFTQAMLRVADDPARVQLRADLWSALAADTALRDRVAESVARRRSVLREWIVRGIGLGELALDDHRANALASTMLALTDGLILHRALDPTGFRWSNIRAVMDALLAGIERPGRGRIPT
jgi:AcrR family transcriptional regulator